MSIDALKLKMDILKEIAVDMASKEEASKSTFFESNGIIKALDFGIKEIENYKTQMLSNDKCDEKGIDPEIKEKIVDALDFISRSYKVKRKDSLVQKEQIKGRGDAFGFTVDYLDKKNNEIVDKIKQREELEKAALLAEESGEDLDLSDEPRKLGQRPVNFKQKRIKEETKEPKVKKKRKTKSTKK